MVTFLIRKIYYFNVTNLSVLFKLSPRHHA